VNCRTVLYKNSANPAYPKAVVPKAGGTGSLGVGRNSRGAVKQKWAVGGR